MYRLIIFILLLLNFVSAQDEQELKIYLFDSLYFKHKWWVRDFSPNQNLAFNWYEKARKLTNGFMGYNYEVIGFQNGMMHYGDKRANQAYGVPLRLGKVPKNTLKGVYPIDAPLLLMDRENYNVGVALLFEKEYNINSYGRTRLLPRSKIITVLLNEFPEDKFGIRSESFSVVRVNKYVSTLGWYFELEGFTKKTSEDYSILVMIINGFTGEVMKKLNK